MVVLTITLLIANIAVLTAAINRIKNLEIRTAHEADVMTVKIENIRMRHRNDIKELEEVMVTSLEDLKQEMLTQEEILEHHVSKATENLFWRIVTTPLSFSDK